jgi:hypothetical protein
MNGHVDSVATHGFEVSRQLLGLFAAQRALRNRRMALMSDFVIGSFPPPRCTWPVAFECGSNNLPCDWALVGVGGSPVW